MAGVGRRDVHFVEEVLAHTEQVRCPRCIIAVLEAATFIFIVAAKCHEALYVLSELVIKDSDNVLCVRGDALVNPLGICACPGAIIVRCIGNDFFMAIHEVVVDVEFEYDLLHSVAYAHANLTGRGS